MKGTLDWQSAEVVNIYDEVSLWSAHFARLLLEHIPMSPNAQVLDIGFGTGFPLLELSQRFGNTAKIYGMDIWPEGIMRTREKIRVMGLENIEIFEQSAEQIPLAKDSLDLICSNLGVNNFDNKEQVISECHRVLKPGAHFCLCTNPRGTFVELFDLFERTMEKMELKKAQAAFENYLAHRDNKISLENNLGKMGFKLIKDAKSQSRMRFVYAQAILDHSLIRIGFLEYWEKLIPVEKQEVFFAELLKLIDELISKNGEFSMTIPILYLQFEKV